MIVNDHKMIVLYLVLILMVDMAYNFNVPTVHLNKNNSVKYLLYLLK